MGSAGIWNLSGYRIKNLAESSSLPVSGLIKWDGTNELGNRVSPGYYVIIINYQRPDGTKGRWKGACVVASY